MERDTQETYQDFDTFVHGMRGSPGFTLTNNTVLEQIVDKTEAAGAAPVLQRSTHPKASNDRSNINTINSVTPKAAKPEVKHTTLKQNAKKKNNVHGS